MASEREIKIKNIKRDIQIIHDFLRFDDPKYYTADYDWLWTTAIDVNTGKEMETRSLKALQILGDVVICTDDKEMSYNIEVFTDGEISDMNLMLDETIIELSRENE